MDMKTAVNHIITALGENPVDHVDVRHPTVAIALRHITEINRELQLPEWWFNTYQVKLEPDHRGIISVPHDTIKWLSKDIKTHVQGGIVVNSKTMEREWDHALEGRISIEVPFEEVPYSFALWVVKEATVRAYISDYGLEEVVQLLQASAFTAQQLVHKEHLQHRNHSTRNTRLGRKLYYWRDA
mgnify:FL=1